MRGIAEVIVVLRVLTSLFVLALCGGPVMSSAQICLAAGLGTHSAERHQPLYTVRPARRTHGWRAACAFKMLKLLLTLEALVLKNGHRGLLRPHTATYKRYPESACRNNLF